MPQELSLGLVRASGVSSSVSAACLRIPRPARHPSESVLTKLLLSTIKSHPPPSLPQCHPPTYPAGIMSPHDWVRHEPPYLTSRKIIHTDISTYISTLKLCANRTPGPEGGVPGLAFTRTKKIMGENMQKMGENVQITRKLCRKFWNAK